MTLQQLAENYIPDASLVLHDHAKDSAETIADSLLYVMPFHPEECDGEFTVNQVRAAIIALIEQIRSRDPLVLRAYDLGFEHGAESAKDGTVNPNHNAWDECAINAMGSQSFGHQCGLNDTQIQSRDDSWIRCCKAYNLGAKAGYESAHTAEVHS